MTNQVIAQILKEISIYLDMEGVAFKPRAYEKVSEIIESMSGEISDIYKNGGLTALQGIPGVGISIAEHIEELIKTNHLKYYEDLKKKTPVDLRGLLSISGLGPKTIKTLYKELKIKNLDDLEKAITQGKIKTLKGFGAKSEENILKGIEFQKKSAGRFVLVQIMPQINEIESRLRELKEVEKIMVAGSVRRKKDTIGDVDILIISNKPAPIMDYFISMQGVEQVLAHGNTKSAIKLHNGLEIDLRVVPEESYGAALNYFTGSKDHNIELRKVAIKMGYKLNEYGLFISKEGKATSDKLIAGKTEEEIYKKLGLSYIEPELREMTGEIEAAFWQAPSSASSLSLRATAGRQGKPDGLPKLIVYGDLKGDLQIQTNWSDGDNSIEEMAMSAIKAGLEYIAITDHTKKLTIANGLDEIRIKKQWQEIDRLNGKFKIQNSKFEILKGTECDILKDGSMDLPDEILSKCDVVGASVHSLFNLSKEDQTNRIKRAMDNPYVDIIFHPTGRILNKRDAYQVNVEELISHAKKTGTILEINASDRSDLKDEHIRKCVESGVKMAIDSDAHSAIHFDWLEFGIAQARRGWAERKDIINAWPLDKMLGFLKR